MSAPNPSVAKPDASPTPLATSPGAPVIVATGVAGEDSLSGSIVIGRIPDDQSSQDKTLPEKQWEALRDQRKQMIDFMTKIFGRLNGAIIIIVLVGLALDQWNLNAHPVEFKSADRFVTSVVINALIAATVAQAGIAFITITKFLFPGQPNNESK